MILNRSFSGLSVHPHVQSCSTCKVLRIALPPAVELITLYLCYMNRACIKLFFQMCACLLVQIYYPYDNIFTKIFLVIFKRQRGAPIEPGSSSQFHNLNFYYGDALTCFEFFNAFVNNNFNFQFRIPIQKRNTMK